MKPEHLAVPPPGALSSWLQTAPGQYLLGWEQAQFDLAVADLFGYNALQLGLSDLDALRANRMPHRWRALPEELAPLEPLLSGHQMMDEGPGLSGSGVPDLPVRRIALITDAAALPFPAACLDLVVLPHTLELSADPHQVLREVERVLVPEGRVVISGFNPASLWGLRQGRGRLGSRLGLAGADATRLYLPETGDFIGPWRLRDWLRLLGFDIESDRYGCYRPAVNTEKWLQRTAWMDSAGARWWPIFGAVYFAVAVKRVRGVRLLGPAWKPRRATASAPVVATNRH